MSYKVCPICGTPAFPNATLCSTCGTTLTDVDLVKRDDKPAPPPTAYDRRYGEADLLEGELRHQGQVYLIGVGLVVLLLICGVGLFFGGAQFLSGSQGTPTPANSPFPTRESTGGAVALETATPRPSLNLPTVTPAPPTATFTPTPGPCERQVQSGDDIISLAYSCGHRSQDVLPLILEMNDLSAPEQLQAGQMLLIPWPTPTEEIIEVDPTSAAMLDLDGRSDSGSLATVDAFFAAQNSTGLPVSYSGFATPTLLPGVTWHIVQPNESMIAIAYQYGTNAETLSQLNPEIPFSQCDFQYDTGGERCMVFLQVGQQIRVPAPLPTATLSPTLSGSETPTFTPTPTFNAPSALSPGNRAIFRRNDMVTLRWVASGTLNPGEAYRVTVENLTTMTVHTADTSELFYIIPGDWQGRDSRRHQYRWTVSIIRLDDPENLTFTTEARLFTWEGRGES